MLPIGHVLTMLPIGHNHVDVVSSDVAPSGRTNVERSLVVAVEAGGRDAEDDRFAALTARRATPVSLASSASEGS
eukprot:1470629-Prymnesium_polylepis.1